MSNALRALPDFKRNLQRGELEAARDAGVDALVAVYHADHRELCAHELISSSISSKMRSGSNSTTGAGPV